MHSYLSRLAIILFFVGVFIPTGMAQKKTGQPIDIATGPPLFHAWANVVKHPAKMEMMENEIAKLENPDHDRLSSCLYPSSASRRSSSFVVCVDMYPPVRTRRIIPSSSYNLVGGDDAHVNLPRVAH